MSRQRKRKNQDHAYNRTVEAHVQWENRLYKLRDEVTTGEDVAFHCIDDVGLNRVFQHMSDTTAWAVFTAYRDEYGKAENVRRNSVILSIDSTAEIEFGTRLPGENAGEVSLKE